MNQWIYVVTAFEGREVKAIVITTARSKAVLIKKEMNKTYGFTSVHVSMGRTGDPHPLGVKLTQCDLIGPPLWTNT